MKEKKTKLAKSLHEIAVSELRENIRFKVRNNSHTLTANNMCENYVTENSSIKDIYNVFCENSQNEIEKICAYQSFRAKYTKLYQVYDYNIENEIENILVTTLDLTQNLDGEKCTPIQALKSYISFFVKNDSEFCAPIKKENERYLSGIKALKKEAKKEAKKVVTFYSLSRAEKIATKTAEFIKLGCDENTAKIMATNFVDNLK